MSELTVPEAVRLAFEWGKANHLSPLNLAITVAGVGGVFLLARLSRGARRLVADVHAVYAQALEDQKRAAERLRAENERLVSLRAALAEELETERRVKEEVLRTLARLRAQAAKKGEDA